MTTTERRNTIRKLFTAVHEDAPGNEVLRAMRGDLNAQTLLIAPPPSAGDMREGLPFADERAKVFHNLALNFRLDTEKDFLIVAAGYQCLKKPNIKNTATAREFVRKVAKRKLFQRYVCVGDLAYQYIFGEGSRSSMQTLAGSILYTVEADFAPLMVMPSIQPLVPENPEDWREGKDQERAVKWFERLMPKLADFVLR